MRGVKGNFVASRRIKLFLLIHSFLCVLPVYIPLSAASGIVRESVVCCGAGTILCILQWCRRVEICPILFLVLLAISCG